MAPRTMEIPDLPRLPVAGLEGRTREIFLKPSRGDFDELPDSGIDDIRRGSTTAPRGCLSRMSEQAAL
jgi:hypothetical protein